MILNKNKKIKRKIRRNPYIVKNGYHLTNKEKLDNILKHGLKRKIYHSKDNFERWVLNNVLYGGKSPIYFFANLDFKKKISELLEYTFEQNGADIILKVNVENFNQIADIPHFLDFTEIALNYDTGSLVDTYLYEMSQAEDYDLEKLWKYNTFLTRGKLPLKKFLTDEKLNEDIIFYTETFCIAENIPAKFIEEIIPLK